MKLHLSLPLCALAASAALAVAAPSLALAQQPTAAPAGSDSDVFDIIKKGADKLQRQAKETKELAPKVKLLEERENDLHKKVTELEQKVAKQQEVIDHLHKEFEKLESAAKTASPSPLTTETSKPVSALPVTEPAVKPTPPGFAVADRVIGALVVVNKVGMALRVTPQSSGSAPPER